MTNAVLAIDGLHKSYGDVVALDGVDLEVAPGEVVGLLGPNGAGKTTLVSIICGLRHADAGSVMVNGVDALAHPQRARQHIGLAPQDLGIYPVVSVRQNLSLFGELAGLSGPELTSEVDSVAEALYLVDLLDRKAGELSGGQKRRLHTAIALLNDPPLILLDESTTGADVETRAALLELVRELARRGSTVLYSTHYLQEVEALDASVVIIESGKVIARGSVDTLISRNGGGVVELTFEGTPPSACAGYEVIVEDSVMRVLADRPSEAMTDILSSLDSAAERVTSVEIIRPSLETVYLSMTGHRYEPGEDLDVAAS